MQQYSIKQSISYSPEVSAGLFDRIIQAIQLEKELQRSRRILFSFVILFLASTGLLPFSIVFFLNQLKHTGAWYFLVTALENTGAFTAFWQNFVLSILESLPTVAIILLSLNVVLFVFVVRLFLHKKGLLLKYVRHIPA